MKTTIRLALAATALGMLPAVSMAEVDCLKVAVSVKHAVTAQPDQVLQIVEKEVGANPGCACEVVKAAIQTTKAEPKLVASIVETAATVVPDKMRLISQCAVAVAPEALTAVQGVMSRLDPNKGEGSHGDSKDAKSSKVANVDTKPAWNPLDFPGQGPVGPTPGGPPILPPGLPPTIPPIIVPPVFTDIDRPVVQPLPENND